MATDEKKQTIREEFFKESFNLAQKYLSPLHSPSHILPLDNDSDSSPPPFQTLLEMTITSSLLKVNLWNYISSLARRDHDGAVIIAPRNFTTKPGKKGHIDAVFFDKKPSYVAIGSFSIWAYRRPVLRCREVEDEAGQEGRI